MTITSMARNQMSTAMMRISSGQRINSAADDAAGLAISEMMNAQIRSIDQGTRNALDMQSLVNTAEGGLSNISDSLIRIRELSVQAANDTNTQAERELIQHEITQLAEGIQAVVDNTQFNTRNLLDGGGQGLHAAVSPDGSGPTVNIGNMSGIAQAIANFNVTGTFEIGALDGLISEVAGARANIGAMSNRFDFVADGNNITSLNLASARSRIADADIAREMMNLEQARVIDQMQVMMHRQAQEREEDRLNPLRRNSIMGQ